MKFIKSIRRWIQRQFENQYGKGQPVETKSNTPDLSGMMKAGAAYVAPVKAAEPVAEVILPEPPPVVAAAPVPEPETECAHIFVCAKCNARLRPPTEAEVLTPVQVPSGNSPLSDPWNSFEDHSLPMRTAEQIALLIPFETDDLRAKRMMSDKMRYLRSKNL